MSTNHSNVREFAKLARLAGIQSSGMELSESIEARVRSTKNRRRYFVIGGIFLALLLTTIVGVTFIVTKNSNAVIRNKVDRSQQSDYGPKWGGKLVLLVDGTKLVAFDYKSKSSSLIYQSIVNGSIITGFDADFHRYIYRSEKVPGYEYKYEVVMSSNATDDVLRTMYSKPVDLTYNRFTGDLYVIDRAMQMTGGIRVISTPEGVSSEILKNLTQPRGLALDAERGFLFVLLESDTIVRAKVDGTKAQEVVANVGKISAFSIDSNNGRIYWVKNHRSIWSCNYNGNGRRLFLVDTKSIETLAIHAGHLFWTWPSVQRATNLFYCEIDRNGDCFKHSTCRIAGDVTLIRGYNAADGDCRLPSTF